MDVLAVLAAPDRQRRAPVALARQRPVDVVLQPAAEAPVLDVLGVPVDGLVGGQQPVAQLSTSRCTRTAWRSRAAACRSASSAGRSARTRWRAAAGRGAEVLDQVGVGVLDEAALVALDALVVGAVEPDGVDDVQAVLRAEAEVVLAEGDRGVHEAGAVVGGDEVAEQDGVPALAVLRRP